MYLKLNNHLILILAAVIMTAAGCRKDQDTPPPAPPSSSTTPYQLNYPANFPPMEIPADNPTTVEGVKLGRMLYYDPILQKDQQKSCSSCHFQVNSFTTFQSNALAHINLGWADKFLWKGKVEGTLEDVMLFEVDDFFEADISRLQNDPNYPGLFKAAFGTEQITSELAAKALAQWFRSMISGNSKFDRYLRYEESLTASEFNGFVLFSTEKGDCFHCHSVPLMTDNLFHNIGLDSVFVGDAQGRFLITGNPSDVGKWKTPTLRNVELTAPYMHDGRFTTLEEVVEHYNTGVKQSETLDPIMTKPGKEFGLGLTPQEVADLVAFLKTLTDTSYINNPALSSPF